MKTVIQVLLILFLVSCSNYREENSSNNHSKIIENDLLNKNEIKELVDIASNGKVSNLIKDSLTNIMFDRINNPKEFDSIHKSFNYHQAPNSKNSNATMDDWNAYEGDSKIWENANIDYLLYEFDLTGNIDGFSGVVTTLQNSVHGNSIEFGNINSERYDFETPMKELNTELLKSKRMIITVELMVFIIKTKDEKRFREIIEKTNLGKITTYNNVQNQ